MKMILIMADEGRLDELRSDLRELDASGYSVLPMLEGSGATGVHAGDRVHPGSLVMVLVVAPEGSARTLFESLARRRERSGDKITRLFLMPVEDRA